MRKLHQCPPTANPKRKYCNVFVNKSGNYDMYKWSPPPNTVNPKNVGRASKPYYCNARAFTDGQDWISTYSYVVYFINGEQARSPYAECDYVL